MAKYKVGDKVKVGGHTATIVKILGTSASGEQMYGVKQDDNGWAYESLEGKMKAANASSKFQPGTKVFVRMYPYNKNDSRGAIGVIKKNRGNTMDVEIDGKTIEVDYRFLTPSPNAATADVVNRNTTIKSSNPVVANAIKACNGNNWTMADAKEWASSLSVIADKDYNDDWLKEGLDSFKRYGKQFANLVGPSEAKKVEDAIRKGRAKDLPRLIGSMKPYKANGSLVNAVAKNASPVKPGERCKWRNGPFEWKGVLVSGKPGNYIVKDDDGRQHVWHGNVYHLDEKYKTISTPFGTFYNSKNATNADRNPESLANWKRILPKLKEFNNLAGWLKGEGAKLMNVARNFDDKKFHSIGYDIQSVCEWSERKSAEILKQA